MTSSVNGRGPQNRTKQNTAKVSRVQIERAHQIAAVDRAKGLRPRADTLSWQLLLTAAFNGL